MKTIAFVLVVVQLFSLAYAQKVIVIPQLSGIEAQSYIILDHHSGKVIAEKNADQKIDPASLTKLMAAYIIYEALDNNTISMDEQVKISKEAWRTEGSRMFIEPESLVSVSDLISGVVIQSGNDASVALAEHIAGSETMFANVMNQKATELGIKNSFFKNATGLTEEGHYATVRDIASISRYLIRDFPKHYELYAVREFSYNGIKQYNRNPLLDRDDSVDGIKTGYTKSAGYCLAASAERDGMRLITVVAGNSSNKMRAIDSASLINYGFRFFATHRIYEAGTVLHTVRAWGGKEKILKLGLRQDLYITVPRGAQGDIDISYQVVDKPEAPIQIDQNMGSIEALYNGESLQRADLVSLNAIERGNFLTRAIDAVLILF